METGLQRILLSVILALPAASLWAQEDTQAVLDRIIKPDVERRHIDEDDLDTEDFELGVYYGYQTIEDFGGDWGLGLRAAYHLSEDLFLEANYGRAKAQQTSYEIISGGTAILTDAEREYSYYNLNLAYNLLPGEIFISDQLSFNSVFYLIGGAGNTTFAESKFFTYNFGAGFKVFVTDSIALNLDVRDQVFERELLGYTKRVNNLATNFGLNVFF